MLQSNQAFHVSLNYTSVDVMFYRFFIVIMEFFNLSVDPFCSDPCNYL